MTSIPQTYPPVPKVSAGYEAYRLQIINNIQKDLTVFLEQDRSSAERSRKKLTRCRNPVGWLGSAGTAVSLAGGTVGATGIGVIPGGVLIGVGVVLGIGSVVASKMEKGILEKLIKFDKLSSLAEAKLFSLREKITKAIQDGKISEEEFKDINDEMRKFGLQRGTILNEGKKLSRSKNGEPKRSSSTRELSDQLALLLKTLKRTSTFNLTVNLNFPEQRAIPSTPPAYEL